jgi:transcriptional antiterminator NusG
MRWYAVHTYSGHEERVLKNLEERKKSLDLDSQVGEAVIPKEDEVEVKNGERKTVSRKILPGYVIIQMILNDHTWHIVRNTPGVTGFVSSGDKPAPLQQVEVDRILKQMSTEVPKIKLAFSVGQSVRVVDGPFAEFIGVVDELNAEKGKAKVLLSLFGRETPVELDFLQVERL